MPLVFEWDEGKAEQNKAEHRVDFEEGKSVFNDPFSVTVSDLEHSSEEQRWVDIGLSNRGRALVVWYTERGERMRIIGCRRATRSEQRQYEAQRSR